MWYKLWPRPFTCKMCPFIPRSSSYTICSLKFKLTQVSGFIWYKLRPRPFTYKMCPFFPRSFSCTICSLKFKLMKVCQSCGINSDWAHLPAKRVPSFPGLLLSNICNICNGPRATFADIKVFKRFYILCDLEVARTCEECVCSVGGVFPLVKICSFSDFGKVQGERWGACQSL